MIFFIFFLSWYFPLPIKNLLCLWNVLSMTFSYLPSDCSCYRSIYVFSYLWILFFYLWNIYIYEMSFLWNFFFYEMSLSMKCFFHEMSYLWNVRLLNFFLWNVHRPLVLCPCNLIFLYIDSDSIIFINLKTRK